MIVWLLTTGEPAPTEAERPLRTGMLARELADRGHIVEWFTTTFDHRLKRHVADRYNVVELVAGVRIHMLHTRLTYRRNISVARMLNHAMIARHFAAQSARMEPPSVIVCSYPTMDLASAAVSYGAARRLPVIIDVRDLWPDIFAEAVPYWVRRSRVDRLLMAPLFAWKRRILRRASAITSISEQYLSWAKTAGAPMRGRRAEVFPLGYPRFDLSRYRSRARDTRRKYGILAEDVVFWFSGAFGKTYDLVPLIDVAREWSTKVPQLKFVLCGDGEMMDAWARAANGLANVIFTGWLHQEALLEVAAIADVGVLAYRTGAPQGLPNKIFEYIAMGVPVISSLEGECRMLIERHGVGLHYSAESVRELSSAVSAMVESRAKRADMGRRAAELYNREYDPEVVYGGFAQFVEEVGNGGAHAK